MRKGQIALVAFYLYTGYLSYTVVRLLGSDRSPRVRMVLLAGWILILLAAIWVAGMIATGKSERLVRWLDGTSSAIRSWDARLRGIFYFALVTSVTPLVYSNLSHGLMDNTRFRYAILFGLFIVAVNFWPFRNPQGWGGRFLLTLLAGAYALMAGSYLKDVVNYPFSLSWSEGNRFYDYSLTFGKAIYLYHGNLTIPYFSPGRYGLWGIWFLIPGLSIAFHRFWDAFLWIVPPFLLGWLLGRAWRQQPGLRLGLALWIGLFISQGPIYAPVLLAAALVIISDRSKPWLRGLAIVLASLYAGLSRWTWFGAVGAWGALLELCAPQLDAQLPWLKRLGKAALIALAGSLPGLLANWSRFAAPQQKTLSLSQPLLWYRLFPNATYQAGILGGLAQATGPLLVVLVWLIISRRWRLDPLQLVATGGVLAVTLVAGLVASVKIGGGSNLHNLDMFLITLVWLLMLYLDQAGALEEGKRDGEAVSRAAILDWPIWVKGWVLVASLLLVWPHYSAIQRLVLPRQDEIGRSLDQLRAQVTGAMSHGEVLFMDQRQLLTFGYLRGVPLVPEYEKKYMMDQAMAGNTAYFQSFYADLMNKRFAMIVSEPLFESYDDAFDPFGEENNAWVKWVSEPVLCYYTPAKTYKPFRVQLLVPREGSKDCDLPQP